MKVSKKRLTQIVTEELKNSQTKEKDLIMESISTIILAWLIVAYFSGLHFERGDFSTGYRDWDQRSLWQKFKDKRFLKKIKKLFTPETVEGLYNIIIEKNPELLKMISSNKDRYSGSRQLRKDGLIDQEDDQTLQRVYIMLKRHHQVKKKEDKEQKQKAYHADGGPGDIQHKKRMAKLDAKTQELGKGNKES